jgi:hypothetical protein
MQLDHYTSPCSIVVLFAPQPLSDLSDGSDVASGTGGSAGAAGCGPARRHVSVHCLGTLLVLSLFYAHPKPRS